MENVIESFELKDGSTLYIQQDDPEFVVNPREDSNVCKFIFWHPDYKIGDKHGYENDAELAEHLADKEHHKFLVYMLDHSGISFSLSNEAYPYNCPWDVSTVGYAVVLKSDWLAAGMTKEFNESNAWDLAKAELDVYDQYLSGDVYGFQLVKTTTCDLGEEHEEVIDSCWGFYGSNWQNNGMIDHLPKEVVEQLTSSKAKVA